MGICCPGIFNTKYGQLSENESDFEPITRTAGGADFHCRSSGEEYQSGSSTLIIVKDEEENSPYQRGGGVASDPEIPSVRLLQPPPNSRRESSPPSVSLETVRATKNREEMKENFENSPIKEDRSDWARRRFKELVVGLEFGYFGIEVTHVKFTTLSCVINRSHGRPMVVYTLDFDLTWEGVVDGTSVDGTIRMEDIMPGEEEAEWYYEVQLNGGDTAHTRAGNVVRNGREVVVDAVSVLIEELQEQARK